MSSANNVHIMYNNEDGQMCYLFGKYSAVGSYTWADEEVVDENGSLSYGSISVVYDGSTYVPAMTYLNKANTANGIKYAYRTVAPAAEDASSGGWDFMIIPALGNGHYALKENKISLESSNNWTSPSATVLQNQLDTTQPKTATPATVDSVIAYKTSKAYETAYLKKSRQTLKKQNSPEQEKQSLSGAILFKILAHGCANKAKREFSFRKFSYESKSAWMHFWFEAFNFQFPVLL